MIRTFSLHRMSYSRTLSRNIYVLTVRTLASFQTALRIGNANVNAKAKRASGCASLNGTETYTSNGVTFNLVCNTRWDSWWDYLHMTYTPDFASCMDGCAMWNTQNTQKCVGVHWLGAIYGPAGLSGGRQCYYFWEIDTSYWTPDNNTDSAVLQEILGPTVSSFICRLILGDNTICCQHSPAS